MLKNLTLFDMITLTISGDALVTFRSFNEWIEKSAVLRLKNESVICIASDGTVCHLTSDFEFARDNDLFPVKAYRLIRTSEKRVI